MESPCEGCIMHNIKLNDEFNCELRIRPHASKTKHCPCLTCLVKMMCTSECDEFRKYSCYIDVGREK